VNDLVRCSQELSEHIGRDGDDAIDGFVDKIVNRSQQFSETAARRAEQFSEALSQRIEQGVGNAMKRLDNTLNPKS
jgi:hypothetical protein